MKEKDGVFNCSYCYFSLNRQNNKFQQKGLTNYPKKGVKRKAPTQSELNPKSWTVYK